MPIGFSWDLAHARRWAEAQCARRGARARGARGARGAVWRRGALCSAGGAGALGQSCRLSFWTLGCFFLFFAAIRDLEANELEVAGLERKDLKCVCCGVTFWMYSKNLSRSNCCQRGAGKFTLTVCLPARLPSCLPRLPALAGSLAVCWVRLVLASLPPCIAASAHSQPFCPAVLLVLASCLLPAYLAASKARRFTPATGPSQLDVARQVMSNFPTFRDLFDSSPVPQQIDSSWHTPWLTQLGVMYELVFNP